MGPSENPLGESRHAAAELRKTWIEVAEAQKVTPPWAKEIKEETDVLKEIKDVLARVNVNTIVAARDRESFSDPWRRVLLKKVSKSTWVLLDENGKALDEPDRVWPRRPHARPPIRP